VAIESSAEKPAPVRQIAAAIAGWVGKLGAIWVEGQLAQISRRPGVGTVFMTLRDSAADISIPVTCPRVLFDGMNPPLVEGARVVIHAKPSYYATRGTLSLSVREIRVIGLGELLAQLERRRQLLAAEGLFAADRKQKLPFLPRRVGLITAPNSAAERDLVENARRRWPGVEFALCHAAMQGTRTTTEILEALDKLEAADDVDVIVIARGGGSVEDLLPFSDETLLRAVSGVRTPVVSAIGHEPDTPLLDLVADIRASTPTDAAKLIVPMMADELRGVTSARERLRAQIRQRVEREFEALAALRSRPVLAQPEVFVAARAEQVIQFQDRARRALGHALDRGLADLSHQHARVRALSPLATLRRGYAVVQHSDGRVISSVTDIEVGADFDLRVADGRVRARAMITESVDLPGATDG
jgi:exodeoxyribonuclease VII large subunit